MGDKDRKMGLRREGTSGEEVEKRENRMIRGTLRLEEVGKKGIERFTDGMVEE